MMGSKVTRLLAAGAVACLAAMAASAQVIDAGQYADTVAPAGRGVPAAHVLDSSKADAPAFSTPANLLEDAPREARVKLGMCAYDPRDRQVAAACRRRLEIAQTP
jgi:hypothetical protein